MSMSKVAYPQKSSAPWKFITIFIHSDINWVTPMAVTLGPRLPLGRSL